MSYWCSIAVDYLSKNMDCLGNNNMDSNNMDCQFSRLRIFVW